MELGWFINVNLQSFRGKFWGSYRVTDLQSFLGANFGEITELQIYKVLGGQILGKFLGLQIYKVFRGERGLHIYNV